MYTYTAAPCVHEANDQRRRKVFIFFSLDGMNNTI